MERGLEVKDENLDDDEKISLNDIIQTKGNYLFSLFRARYGEEKFNTTLDQFIKSHPHQSFLFKDFNQVFKKTKGKIKLIALLRGKKKITKARGTLQYIISDYQNTGLIGHIFKCLFDELEAIGITDFEAGTMMEDNDKPINAFKKFGGEIIKVYRIYGKDIKL